MQNLPVVTDQEVFHGHPQHPGQRQQVVHAGQALPVLPFINGLRIFKPEVGLKVPHGHARRLAEPPDVAAGAGQVDDREYRTIAHALSSPFKQVGRAAVNGIILPDSAALIPAKKLRTVPSAVMGRYGSSPLIKKTCI